jgi:hypothetical protein
MKDFTPPEESLELKKLEFELDKDSVFGYWNLIEHGKDWWTFDTRIYMDSVDYIEAPLFSQAFRFFREKYDLFISIMHYENGYSINDLRRFDTHEEAELACLKKLIELVKQKQ